MNDTNEPNTEIENAEAVADALAEWWHASARDLPWRFGRTTAWGVLVSEVMSQQTQMSRVVPYWNDWMERWPDAVALADAAKADVITAWGRLGYPRRALRLQECARVVASDYDNKLPRTYDELLALPGIGDYTASAVMSFAFGERIAVVDTNIRRVLSRVFLARSRLAAPQDLRNVRWRSRCCRRMMPQNADGSTVLQWCGISPLWNWARPSARQRLRCARRALFRDIACFCIMVVQDWGNVARGRVNVSKVRIVRCVGWC